MTDVVALAPVKVQRRAPGRMVKVGEIRTILAKVISFRAKVVVDHIQTYGEFLGMRGVNEFMEICNAAIAVLKCERKNAVIPPVPTPGELRKWHQLDRRYAEIRELVEMRYESRERAIARKCSDVQLVKDAVAQRHT